MAAAIAAIILAAGSGRRFNPAQGDPKVLALLDGKPLLRHVAEAAAASRAKPVIVVAGPNIQKIQAALAGLDAVLVRNSDLDAGLSHSLALGLAQVPAPCAGAVILLADMPRIGAAIINRLIEAFENAEPAPRAVVPVRQGRRGNPVLLGRAIFRNAGTLSGDRGARALIEAGDRGIITCEIDDAAIETDVDTVADLAALQRDPMDDNGAA